MKAKKEKKFPQTVFVAKRKERDDSEYLQCDDAISGFDDGDDIGNYELVSTAKVSVTTTYDIAPDSAK